MVYSVSVVRDVADTVALGRSNSLDTIKRSSLKQPHAGSHEETLQTTSHDQSSISTHARTSLKSSVAFDSTVAEVTEASSQEPSAAVSTLVSMERSAKGTVRDHGLQASAKVAERKASILQKRRSKERASIELDWIKASTETSKHDTSTSSSSHMRSELASRSRNAIKTWSLKRKDALIPDAMKLYALPEPTTYLDPRATMRAAKDSVDASTGLSSGTRRQRRISLVRLSTKSGRHKYRFHSSGDSEDDLGFEAVGPGSDRTKLSVYEATEELAEANVSIAAVKDLLLRLEGKGRDPMKEFTREYLIAQHLYGTMTDYLRDLWISTTKLGTDVDCDLDVNGVHVPGLDRLIAYSSARGEAIENFDAEMQREKLARWLKMVLNSLNELNWEHLKLDFTKWVRGAQDNDTILRDALEHIGEHMDEVLNLLTISRYAIEESLGSHLVVAAESLTQFYEEMKIWHEQVEQKARSRYHRGHLMSAAIQSQRLQQLLAIAKDEKERQRRNLEINSGLYKKMLQAMGSAPRSEATQKHDQEDRPPSPDDTPGRKKKPPSTSAEMQRALAVGKAVDKLLKKSDTSKTVVIGAPGGGGAQHVIKPQIEITHTKKRPFAHLEAMFMRAIAKARESLEAISGCAKDREEHVESVMLAHKYAKKRAKENLRRARSSALLGLGGMNKESDLMHEVQATTLIIPKEGLEEREHQWNDEEIVELLDRKKELSEKLNSVTIPITLAGVWGKRRFHSQQQKLQKAGRNRVLLRRTSKLFVEVLDAASSSRRPSQIMNPPVQAGSRRPSYSPAPGSRRPSQSVGAGSRRPSVAMPVGAGSRRPSRIAHGNTVPALPNLPGSGSRRPSQAVAPWLEEASTSSAPSRRDSLNLYQTDGSHHLPKKKLRKASTLSAFASNAGSASCTDLSDLELRPSNFAGGSPAYSRRSSHANIPLLDESEGAEDDDNHCLNSLLKTLVALEGKDLNRDRRFAEVSKATAKLFARSQRRWGDIWVFNEQDFTLWFKKNPLEPFVETLLTEVGNALSSGTLLLGRKGEADLKELQYELKTLTHTLQQETEERLLCVEAKISFDEAAWYFRTHFPLELLMKKFAPIWAGLKERINFGTRLRDTQEAMAGMENVDGADKKFQDHMSLQSQLQTTETNAMIRHDLVANIKSTSEKLAEKREFLKAFIEKFTKFEALRTKVGGMRMTYREMQKKLVDTMQELRFITMGIARQKEKGKKMSVLGVEDPFERSNSFMWQRPWEEQDHHEPQQSASARRAQEMLKLLQEKMTSPHAAFSFATPLFRSKGKRRRKKKGMMEPERGSHETVLQFNAEKIREMMEHMEKAGGILKGRLERKKEDVRKMLDKMGNRIQLPLTKEELERKWKSDMNLMRSKLGNLMKMKHFWDERLNHWYDEVRKMYGFQVQEALKDQTRHGSTHGNAFLLSALSSSFAKEMHSVPQISITAKGPGSRQAMKSLVFEQAMQTLTEIDSIRQVTSDWRRGTSFMQIENSLAGLPPEMKEHVQRIQTSLEKDDALVRNNRDHPVLPSLPSVFGGRMKSKSGHLFRSTLGRSMKRGTTIRDRVMQIFMKANGGLEVGGDEPPSQTSPDKIPKRTTGLAGQIGIKSIAAGTRRPQGSRVSIRPRTFEDMFLDLSGRKSEPWRKQKRKHRESQRGTLNAKRSSRRQSVSFHTEDKAEDGIYEDDGSDADSDIIERMRQRDRVGDPRQYRRQSSSSGTSSKRSTRSRPISASSNRSDGRHSVTSAASSKRSRRQRDGDMDEDIDRLKNRAENLERRRRKRENRDTDPSTARVHMLRLFMDDAEAGEEDKQKTKSTRFKQRASIIVEANKKGTRRTTRKLLQDIRGRHGRMTHTQGYRGQRRSDKRLNLAEENRRHTVGDKAPDMGLSGTTALRKNTPPISHGDLPKPESFQLGKMDSDSDLELEGRSENIPRRTLKVESLAYKDEGEDESEGTSHSASGSSSSSRNMAELDEVIQNLEEERNRGEIPGEDSKKSVIYSSVTSVPQLGLRLLRNCRDRMIQEFSSFEKAYDRAAAYGVQKRKGRHRSSTFHAAKKRHSLEKEELLTADGFIWLAAKLGYGEDDARAIFDHLTFAAGAETVSTEVITEGDEEHGPSVTRDGFLSALRTALPLNNMMQLRARLEQRYGRTDTLFDITNGGAEAMTLATFCTLCESVGAIVKEATPLFHQMELHNEIPPDYVGGVSQVTKRAFVLSLRHAEALIAARRMTKRLATVARMTGVEAVERSETGELTAAGITAKSGSFGGRGSDAIGSSLTPEGSEHGSQEGPSIHTAEKAIAWYHLFVSSVDKRYHDQPLSLDAMRAAVKNLVPFKEDVRLLFRLAQRHTHSGGMRARIQDFALRAIGGLGHTCKVLAEAVGYDMTAHHSHRSGKRYNAASVRVESARLAARQAHARRLADGRAGAEADLSDLEFSAGLLCTTGEDSGEFADESVYSSGSGDMMSFKDRCDHTQSVQLRSMVPRKGRAALANKTELFSKTKQASRQRRSPWKPLEERRKQFRAPPLQIRPGHRGAQSKSGHDKPSGDIEAANDNDDSDDDDDKDMHEEDDSQMEDKDPPKKLQVEESFQSQAMRKKSVINTDTASSRKHAGFASDFGQSGDIAELGQHTGEDAGSHRSPMRKRSMVLGRRPTMPSLEEEGLTRTAKRKPSVALQFGRTPAGTEAQEGDSAINRSPKRRESGMITFDNLALGAALGSSSEGEEKTKRAARPGAIRKINTTMQLIKKSATMKEEDPRSSSPQTLEKRRLQKGKTIDASNLQVSAREEPEDDGDLWKWKQDPTEASSLARHYASMGDVLRNAASTPEVAEVRPDSRISALSEGSLGAGSSSAADTDHAEGSVASGSLREPQQFSKERQATEQLEAGRHRKRLDLFDGDDVELQIATQRLQDCRVRFLLRFRSPSKAFEVLAGSRDAKLTVTALQTKVEKVLSFNPLDAERVVTVLSAVQEAPEFSYNDFLHVMRFATPVHSILEFRTRLVERYCQVECAFRVFGFTEKVELDVGLFERPMLGAGIVSSDAHRLFRVADTAQPGGPRGYLSVEGLRFALDHAHVLAWLEAFYVRVAAAKGRTGQSVHDAIAGAGKQDATGSSEGSIGMQITEDEPIATAGMFQLVLANLEFPAEFALDTFAFLQRRSPQVTLAGFAQVVQHAFGSDTRRPGTTRNPTNQEKAASGQQGQGASKTGLMGKAAAKAKAQRTLGDFGLIAKTAGRLAATAASRGFVASGNAPGTSASPSDGSAAVSASAAGESQATMRVTEDVREEALVQTRCLRRHVITHFANYQEAYHVFNRKSPLDGVALDEWMEAMEAFGFSDAAGWEQVFGHIIDWRHLRWDPRYRGTEGRVTLAGLANALDHAAPCTTPIALRKLLQEKYGTMQKAWVQLSGREGVEELSLSVWQQAMHKIAVVAEDAGHLHAVLRAAPISERVPDNHNLQLSRVAFLSAMRSAEAVTRLFELLWRIANLGSMSCAFEARVYPLEPLSVTTFEEQLAEMMQVTEARLLFAYLDVNQEGLVSICDLLDALTIMQATYFPYAPPPGSRAAAEQHRELFSHAISDALTPLPIYPGRDIASTTPSSAAISPTDVKGRSSSGMRSLSSSFNERLQNVSTALPDSIISDGSEDGSEAGSPGRQQRPWTSMSVVGGSGHPPEISAEPARTGGSALGFAPGVSSVRAGSIANRGSKMHSQGAFTHAPFLPHLDLAAAHRASALRRPVQPDDLPHGWEQVNNISQSALGNSTSPTSGLDASIEDHLDMIGPHSEVVASSERVPMVPRPRSELAASNNQDRPFVAGFEDSSVSMPRPHSELGMSRDRDRPLARTSPLHVGRGSLAARAQTPNSLEAARDSAAVARDARPSSELGMARRGSPTKTPRATSSHGEAKQTTRSPLPALSGARQKAKPGHRATGKRSSTPTANREKSSGGTGHSSARH